MYPDSEILFPPRCIPQLRNLRGEQWARFIDRLTQLPDDHEDVLGFSLLMIQLCSCLTCNLDSYRASLGCCTCARRTVAGFKGSDEELIQLFEEAREKVRAYLSGVAPILSTAEEEEGVEEIASDAD
ncbi:MAG: hypothetical protein ACUVSG_09500 [Anaerolineae bacterium]